MCSDCYQIYSGWTKSTLTKKITLILCLPWWDAHDRCTACDEILKFNSDSQKWCSNCITIYIGCRHCLTTNVIFGAADQLQCKKCKRVSLVNIDSKYIESLVSTKFISNNHHQNVKYMNNSDKTSNSLKVVYDFIRNLNYLSPKLLIDWISHLQIINLENDDPFDLPIPIMFIPLNNSKDECYYCSKSYYLTPIFNQKYCKYCLFLYIKYTATNNNLDVCISTKITKCNRHEQKNLKFYKQNIQEWCNNCSEVLYFKQIVTNHKFYDINNNEQKFIENEKICKLCGKIIYDQILSNNIEFKMCSNCYQISSGWIGSTLTKKTIPILYLPRWDAHDQCIACDQILKFNSDNQKWCTNCIIIYIGCRYCLTTNIIFGITDKSQCKKCKRISLITINIKYIERDIFVSTTSFCQIANYVNNNTPLEVYNFIRNLNYSLKSSKSLLIDLLSNVQVTNLKDSKNTFSPIVPIMFIPFNNDEKTCHYCKKSYSVTFLFSQKYCRSCLNLYMKHTVSNNNLDICISTKITKCNRNEPRNLDFCTQNVKEWCNNCSEVSYFKQIVTNHKFYSIDQGIIESKEDCKLCRNLIHKKDLSNNSEFRLCTNCYLIISILIESIIDKKTIPILHLPWYDSNNQCTTCDQILEFNSNYQKWCSNCIVIHVGCKYCLTTNIIFGMLDQSQCKKCKRISLINIDRKHIKGESIVSTKFSSNNHYQIVNYVGNIDKTSNSLKEYNHVRNNLLSKPLIDWISYLLVTNLENNGLGLPMPMMFIPLNNSNNECYYCRKPYSLTLLFNQKYCKYCLFVYIKHIANNKLDIFISTKITGCNRHESRNITELGERPIIKYITWPLKQT
ncbi:hypothetical protein RclHR1_19600005 [Rhizophagus clarus]|uniref:Uncharacterized protein n=1 Tax=Rhizophagus clarus TaxID=94130 RepID=A0A2Z6QUE2_9GLOM|nr:hypothetical protein RclHR1_19600005 [Rhizophagus clarus]